ncbi:M15 family metallopeptidase [Rhodosalinus sp.]|uniref:M15 family metallopeptidase n=1 Tax=Rhodosalinus sp. TaxID=2047741 RepID=UPI0035648F1F
MRAIPVIVAAIALLAALLGWLLYEQLRPPQGMGLSETGPSVDSAARIEIERLRQQIETMQERDSELRERLGTLENDLRELREEGRAGNGGAMGRAGGHPPLGPDAEPRGPNTIRDAYAEVVLIADRRNVNKGLTVAGPRFLEEFLGRPRETLSDRCEPMTNPELRERLVLETVGPIRVHMLQPAVDSLRRVFENVRRADPDLHDRIASSGSLCVRRIRGTQARTSTHAFGLAVDLNLDGTLDLFADGRTQMGLTILADFFHEEGWVWGAGFGREDSMHFEVSRQQLERWREDGRI